MEKRNLVIFVLFIVSMFLIAGCQGAVGGPTKTTKTTEKSQNTQSATSTWSSGASAFPQTQPFINTVRYSDGRSKVQEIRVYGLDRVEDGGNGAISLTVGERMSIMPGQTIVVNGLSIKYNSTFLFYICIHYTKKT